MTYLYGALYCGLVCVLGQFIYDHSKLTPGHITSLFVVIGVFLDFFDIYDKILVLCGGGASLPITSFGHSLIHGTMIEIQNSGFMGAFMGVFKLTTSGIVAAIVFSFIVSILFKPKS